MTSDDIRGLVDLEIARIASSAQRERICRLLKPPEPIVLSWEYGADDEQFDCWRVGISPDGRYTLVYSEGGFGPSYPWGFVDTHSQSMGYDSQWYLGLEDAAIGCGLLPAPPGYEVD